jgi:hypothetical protein
MSYKKTATRKGPPGTIFSAANRQILPPQDDEDGAGSNFRATPFMQ